MNADEPRVRRRGFFFHSSDAEPDTGEYENAEGVSVRSRGSRSSTPRQFSSGRRARPEPRVETGEPEIRLATGTGSRRPSHWPR